VKFLLQLSAYLRDIARWVSKGRALWLTLIVIVCPACSLLVPVICHERQIRILAAALQTMGFLTIAIGLHDARRAFRKSGWRQGLGTYVSEFITSWPTFGQKGAIQAGAGQILGGATIKGRLTIGIAPNVSLEERFQILEDKLNTLQSFAWKIEDDLSAAKSELTKSIDREREDRRTESKKISDRLTDSVAGGLHIEALGLAAFIAGMIASTFPVELASLISGGGQLPLSVG
jgi:hypothetical protein